MKLNSLLEQTLNVAEETTSGDIAYIPAHLGAVVSPALKVLKKKKKKWKVEVKEDVLAKMFVVSLEDGLVIRVNEDDWTAFQEEFGSYGVIDRDGYFLFEAQEDNAYLNLKRSFSRCLIRGAPKDIQANLSKWMLVARGGNYVTPEAAMVRRESWQANIKSAVKDIWDVYADDKGAIEMIVGSLDDNRPLGGFEVFDRYTDLFSGAIRSNLGGVIATYTGRVDLNFVPSEVITLRNAATSELDEVDEIDGVKVAGMNIYPTGKMFSSAMLKAIVDGILDIK